MGARPCEDRLMPTRQVLARFRNSDARRCSMKYAPPHRAVASFTRPDHHAHHEVVDAPMLKLYPDFAEKAWDEYRNLNVPDEITRRDLDGLRKAGLDTRYEPTVAY